MIDFRYHIVSLVSVFLALAIGVVLGAGPLRESIGATLTDQVAGLREDTDDLRQAVANRDVQLAEREAFIQAVAPALVTGRLAGRSAVVVTLPDADGEQVEAVTEALAAAGADVTGQVALEPAWVDPERQTFRRTLASQLLPALEAPPGAESGAPGELAALLADALVAPPGPDAGGTGDDAEDGAEEGTVGGTEDGTGTVLEALTGGELVTVDGALAERADAAVVVAGAPLQEDAEGAGSAGQVPVEEWLPVLAALDARSSGAVVVAPQAAQDGGLLAAVRSGSASERLSSVDSLGTTMGPVTTVLALREQLDGGSGHYGHGDAATAVVPELPGAAAS